MIPTQTKAALATTAIAFAAGIWLFLAPSIVDYQNDWKTLIDATKSDMWTGGVLVGIATLALLLFPSDLRRASWSASRRAKANESTGE